MSELRTSQQPAAVAAGLCALLLLWPLAAWAHVESGAAGGFLSGLSHPVSGLDHVVAMIAVGLWGAQLGRPALWLLPVMFPTVMAAGAFLERVRERLSNQTGISPLQIRCHLKGSLAFTGKGHASDRAVILGLAGFRRGRIRPRYGRAFALVEAGLRRADR